VIIMLRAVIRSCLFMGSYTDSPWPTQYFMEGPAQVGVEFAYDQLYISIYKGVQMEFQV
jgi:hypothetical protein